MLPSLGQNCTLLIYHPYTLINNMHHCMMKIVWNSRHDSFPTPKSTNFLFCIRVGYGWQMIFNVTILIWQFWAFHFSIYLLFRRIRVLNKLLYFLFAWLLTANYTTYLFLMVSWDKHLFSNWSYPQWHQNVSCVNHWPFCKLNRVFKENQLGLAQAMWHWL